MSGYLRRIRGFRRDIRLFLLMNLVAYVGFGVFALIYNLYLYELGLREDYIGALNAVQTLATAAAALSFGPVLRRIGAWRCLVAGIGVFLVAASALALVTAPAVLLVFAAALGVGLAFLSTVTMPFIIEWGRMDQRADIAALTFSLISLALTAGSLVGGLAPPLLRNVVPALAANDEGTYRFTLLAGIAVAAIGLWPVLRMSEACRTSLGGAGMTTRLAESGTERRQARRDVAVFVAAGGLMAIGVGMVVPFYNVYLTTLGASSSEIGYIFAAGGLCAAVIGLMAPALANRVGSLPAVLMVRLSIVPWYVLLIVNPSLGAAIIAHVVRSTSISMAWPLDSTFIAEVLPARYRASVFGLRSAAWNLTFSGASLVAGWVIVRQGYGWPFFSLALCSTLSVALFVGYFGRHPAVRAGTITSALSSRARASQAVGTGQDGEGRAGEDQAGVGDRSAGPMPGDVDSPPLSPAEPDIASPEPMEPDPAPEHGRRLDPIRAGVAPGTPIVAAPTTPDPPGNSRTP
ncbi:MAG: MFS transporter [Chloroflexia bacterium]|nr:MFS transporter [Chloroflexia bacterium]